MKMKLLSRTEAEGFYAVHKARPFFADLVKFMTSGPVVLMVLEGEGAVAKNREIMGATDPKKAAEGTIRKDFATDIEKNTVHGSDSVENAQDRGDATSSRRSRSTRTSGRSSPSNARDH